MSPSLELWEVARLVVLDGTSPGDGLTQQFFFDQGSEHMEIEKLDLYYRILCVYIYNILFSN